MYQRCVSCADYIKNVIGDFVPETAVVLGSGLGGFAGKIDVLFTVEYKDIPGFPVSTVSGHRGRFLFGICAGKKIAVAEGRVHTYEGYSSAESVIPVRVFKLLGVKNLILTNAAGGINKDFKPGDIMLITDHIGFFIDSPLKGANIEEFGTRFPDMTNAYDKELRSLALRSAEGCGIKLKQGVYAQLKGPQYETPAEVTALSVLGADAVGMSTAIETVAACHAGLKVCGFSVIANVAVNIESKPLSHNEVVENSKKAEGDLCKLLSSVISEI